MPLQAIRDPTFYQWLFFLQRHSLDTDKQQDEHVKAFREVLEEAWKWAGGEGEPPPFPPFPPSSPQVSFRLASLPWNEKDERRRELEARTLLDTFYIQLGHAQRGEAEPEVFALLASQTPDMPDGELPSHAFLGKAICLCGEVDEAPSKDELTALARASWQGKEGSPPKTLEGFTLPFGFFAPVPDAECEAVIFLYPPPAVQEASRFVHFVLPQLLLNLVKVRTIAENYRRQLLPRAQRQEQELDALLKRAANPRLSLEELELLNTSISRQQAAFIESISILEEWLETMRLCLRNLELLFDDQELGEERASVQRYMVDRIKLLVEQMEADRRYLHITRQQADIALQSLSTITGIREAQWERRMVILLGLFTVMELPQLFPELAWWWRLLLFLLGTAILALGYRWLKKR